MSGTGFWVEVAEWGERLRLCPQAMTQDQLISLALVILLADDNRDSGSVLIVQPMISSLRVMSLKASGTQALAR